MQFVPSHYLWSSQIALNLLFANNDVVSLEVISLVDNIESIEFSSTRVDAMKSLSEKI